jgi:hypothetical protein
MLKNRLHAVLRLMESSSVAQGRLGATVDSVANRWPKISPISIRKPCAAPHYSPSCPKIFPSMALSRLLADYPARR